ncbi:MAG: hypothetical protein ACRDPK_04900 [Carbonactinosporaceae bacterium]
MSVTRDDLHHLVEEIDEDQVQGALELLRQFAQPSRRRPAFVGMFDSGKGDLAQRSSEILRAEFGEPRS